MIAKAVNPGGKSALNLMVGYRAKDVLGCISYVAAGQQASPFQDPWKAFKDWIGTGGSGVTVVDKLAHAAQERHRRCASRSSTR